MTFSPTLLADLESLLRWRRDVRHFRPDPVDSELIHRLLDLAMLAPSVGFSQPWRWVLVNDAQRRTAISENFDTANRDAAKEYDTAKAVQYNELKLAGLREAPVHLAVFADTAAPTGQGLGRQTMPDTLVWSVVMAIHALWLAARAAGLGLGWVSILNPAAIHQTLDVPADWTFVAYLCLGWPSHEDDAPLLERVHWEERLPRGSAVMLR